MRSKLLFGIVFSALALPMVLAAQTKTNSSGTGGMHEIRGKIYLPNGKGIDTPIEVELQSTNFPTLKLFTDMGGGYSFQNLAPGNYCVVVNAGEQFEIVREYVTIDTEVQTGVRAAAGRKLFTVPVFLQVKLDPVFCQQPSRCLFEADRQRLYQCLTIWHR